ncbi:MAG: type II toxin-antitoxin system RelE/ParE family toxin [Bacteroidetes bacterium]|nr:MAG: type II toxin-antitoxin system RelE/ParE family toxin [Bacteroidota bacterium]
MNEPDFSRIINSIKLLSQNPRNINVKKLVSKENEYRLRVGNYRVLFFIEENIKEIKVSRVLHRQEAYK